MASLLVTESQTRKITLSWSSLRCVAVYLGLDQCIYLLSVQELAVLTLISQNTVSTLGISYSYVCVSFRQEEASMSDAFKRPFTDTLSTHIIFSKLILSSPKFNRKEKVGQEGGWVNISI